MLSPIKLRIRYAEKGQITLYFLFFRYRILPKKQSKKRLSRKNFLSRLFEKGKKKRKKRQSEKLASSHKKKKASASDILDFLKSSSGFLNTVLNSFLKRSKIKVAEVSVVVATEDPSKTAIMYGLVSQAAAYMLELLHNFTTLKKSYRGAFSIIPDFTNDTSSIKLDIQLEYRLLHFLGLVFSALIYIMKNPRSSRSEGQKNKNFQSEE